MFKVRRQVPELVRPAKPTPHELKPLSDIDDQEGLRFHIPVIQFYNHRPSMSGKDPAAIIRTALADTLVPYYPFAGRMREGPNRKLMVECTGEGVLFIEADADVRLADFGHMIHPPFPCIEELLYDVPGSSAILHAPLLLIQVTRLQCGGFIFALRLHHCMSDAVGLVQFMSALGELARGATTPSVLPVWERHILNARSPPRVTCTHREYGNADTKLSTVIIPNPDNDQMEHRSFFFGPAEISALRSHAPPHLRNSYSQIELITACAWKCRTLALRFHPDDEVCFICIVNVRYRPDFKPLLPKGYYGNALAYPAAVATAGDLCGSPLGYALDLVKKAKLSVTVEYMRSVADFIVTTGRRCKFRRVRSYEVSDVTRAGFDEVDFRWGKAAYGGPVRGSTHDSSKLLSFGREGEKGIILPISLPAKAMERFDQELERMVNKKGTNTAKKATLISSVSLSKALRRRSSKTLSDILQQEGRHAESSLTEFKQMEQGATSFLFAGTKFRKDKFAGVFARFQGKKETENVDSDSSLLPSGNTEAEVEQVRSPPKKRKRKKSSAGGVEGFSVFKPSKETETTGSVEQNREDSHEEALREKRKEWNKQIQRDALFRKGHGIHVSGNNIPSPLQSFSELSSRYGCDPYLLCNLKEFGYKEPTPIQRQTIPVILSGRECFACAPTGSGKTLAFVCPILMKLKNPSKDGIRALILCPTRELGLQTSRECMKMARGNKFRIRILKKEHLKNPNKFLCDILISTPLRLKIAISKKKVDLSRVEFLVLDESDKLFEPGMLKQTDYVVKACSNPSIVRSLFSATLPDYIEDLARSVMHDAVRIVIGMKNTASETIKQKLIFAGSEEGKLIALRQSFAESLNPPVLIFLQSKERAKDLFEELKYEDIRVDVIHSDLSEKQRETSVDDFRAGKTWVLIATDVVARGMDFKGVNCVINYDFPDSTAAYIHRIGRTGRAGRSGDAVTLYTEADIPLLRNIGNVMKQKNQEKRDNAVSGQEYEFPSWILDLPKRKWRKYRPGRDAISTALKD